MKIMVVDDEKVARRTMERLVRRRGLGQCILCESGAEALRHLAVESVDVVLLDLIMPEMNGMKVLELAKPHHPHTEFVVITAQDDVDVAVQAVRLGAYDYLVKPVDPERLVLTIERAYEKRSMRAGLEGALSPDSLPPAFSGVITASRCMREQLAYAAALARGGRPVLITGDSGTGKELFARGIHLASQRAKGPFVAVNVSAVPESLFESQFFGHRRGAYTGAGGDHEGYFQQAHGGTLFLDELGELPLNLQPKLLRVLEENSVVPLGSRDPVALNVGIVSATNRDLDQACAEGRFRIDLLYRLRTAHINLPPLSAREGDVALLAEHFLKQACRELDRPRLRLTANALFRLKAYHFPGNVRELEQIVYNAALRCTGSSIDSSDLLPQSETPDPMGTQLCTLRENEARHVLFVLKSTGGDRHKTAKILGVGLRQVQRKIAALQKDPRWRHLLNDI